MLFFSVEAEKSQILQTKGTVEKSALIGGGGRYIDSSRMEKRPSTRRWKIQNPKRGKKASLFLKAGFFFFKLLKNFPLLT